MVYNVSEQCLLVLATLIPFLIAIAFYTLAERKIMASIQRRRGPNVVGFFGLLQPLVDGIKLLLKEVVVPARANYFLFLFAPVIALTLSFTLQSLLPFTTYLCYVDVSFGLLALFALSSLNAYSVILSGWASNSKYAFLGSLRAVAQLISYELVIGFILIILILITGSARLADFVHIQTDLFWFIIPFFPLALIFFIAILAETNRTPFDLPEAESELVAGYNVEYSAITFAMFFLAEYCNMIVMAFIITLIFFGGWHIPLILLPFVPEILIIVIKVLFFCLLFIFIRSTLPRYRFDQLMDICWNAFLPTLFGFFWLACMYSISVAWPIAVGGSFELISYRPCETFVDGDYIATLHASRYVDELGVEWLYLLADWWFSYQNSDDYLSQYG